MVKKKQTSKEITDALKRGGIESTSSNFDVIVYTALRRLQGRELLKSGDAWGIAEWWPATMRNAQSKISRVSAPQKKKSAKKKKGRTGSDKPPIAKPSDENKGSMKDRVLPLIKMGLTPDEIAKQINAHPKVVKMLLGSLVKKQVIQKSEGGKYLVN